MSAFDLEAYLKERRLLVDAALDRFLPSEDTVPPSVHRAMRYSVLAGGKRLRPLLVIAGAELVGAAPASVMPTACALEMIHTYSLVHDDLPAMDNDTMRRGRPTLHVVAGEGMAILAGDGLLTEAFAVMAAAPAGAVATVHMRQLRVISIIARAAGASGMVGGQALDLTGSDRGPGDAGGTAAAEQLASISAKKTGAMIRASAVAGAIIGGASDHDVALIDDAAAQFGLAFHNHHTQLGYFPTGGWDWWATPTYINGTPAVGAQQEAGWGFQILPYLEAVNTWKGGNASNDEDRIRVAMGTPNPLFFCPSRRPPQTVNFSFPGFFNNKSIVIALGDYAASNWEITGVVRTLP